MLVFNGSKYHVKPCNVESQSVRQVLDEAKIPGEMSLHLTVKLVFLSALMKANGTEVKHGRGICNGIRVGKHNFCIILCICPNSCLRKPGLT